MPTFSDDSKRLITRRTFDMIFTPEVIAASTQAFPSTRSNPMRAVTVYSGSQPTAQQVESNWSTYKSTSAICLAHYNNLISFSYNEGTLTYYFTNTLNAITANALHSGTATWAIIWMATTADITLTSIPSNSKFIVVPVTDTSGVGTIRYTNTTATQGQAFIPYDGGMTITEV